MIFRNAFEKIPDRLLAGITRCLGLKLAVVLTLFVTIPESLIAMDKDRDFATPLMQMALRSAIQAHLDSLDSRKFADTQNGVWATAEAGSFEP